MISKKKKVLRILQYVIWIILLSYSIVCGITNFISNKNAWISYIQIVCSSVGILFWISLLIPTIKTPCKLPDNLKKYSNKIHKLFKEANKDHIEITIFEDTIIFYDESTDEEIIIID